MPRIVTFVRRFGSGTDPARDRDRPDGGRGFGFTGGHVHKNWGNDNFRKLVLNALLWTAKAEVPADGAASSVSEDDLKANLDKK